MIDDSLCGAITLKLYGFCLSEVEGDHRMIIYGLAFDTSDEERAMPESRIELEP